MESRRIKDCIPFAIMIFVLGVLVGEVLSYYTAVRPRQQALEETAVIIDRQRCYQLDSLRYGDLWHQEYMLEPGDSLAFGKDNDRVR